MRASVVNTGEPAWMQDAGGFGTVQLNARVGTESFSIQLPTDTPTLSEARLDEIRLDSPVSGPDTGGTEETCSGIMTSASGWSSRCCRLRREAAATEHCSEYG